MDKVYTLLGARNYATEKRQTEDYYATHPDAVRILLTQETFDHEILEPCCGEGHMSKVLEEHGYNVESYDLYDRGYGEQGDFMDLRSWWGDVITNPPYKNALDFVKHAVDIVDEGHKVAMLLRIQFLEGKARRKFFDENPPKTIYVFSSRIACAKNGEFGKYSMSRAMCFAWFIWEKGYKGDPIIKWVN